jgi:outer membrane immunogenic protein
MKRIILAGVGALAMVSTMGAANAADLPRREAMPMKAAPMYAAPYNWTGFYIGVNGGGGFGSSEWNNARASSGNFDMSGAVVGGTLGYNWQMNQVVFGLEGDMDWSNIKGSTTCGLTSCNTSSNWLATVRGRVGYAFDRFMPYVTGGLALGDVKAEAPSLGSTSETKAGWTLGGGLEVAIAGPWTAKVEYLYADLGKANCDTSVCRNSTDVDFHTNLVRAGINYRF